jgi:hypothetical protein
VKAEPAGAEQWWLRLPGTVSCPQKLEAQHHFCTSRLPPLLKSLSNKALDSAPARPRGAEEF